MAPHAGGSPEEGGAASCTADFNPPATVGTVVSALSADNASTPIADDGAATSMSLRAYLSLTPMHHAVPAYPISSHTNTAVLYDGPKRQKAHPHSDRAGRRFN